MYADRHTGSAFMIPFTSGAISAALGVVVVTPFDVIKTRRQSTLENVGEEFGNKQLKLRGQDKKTMVSITKKKKKISYFFFFFHNRLNIFFHNFYYYFQVFFL